MTRTDIWQALHKELRIEENFNCRVDYGDIEGLMLDIVANGLKKPIHAYQKKGDIMLYTIEDGHRRYKAVSMAIERGLINPEEFKYMLIKSSKGTSDVDRVLSLITHNSGKPLNMLEEASVYKRALVYGSPVKDIAAKTGKSVAHINNCLTLLEAGEPTKKMIIAGSVAPTLVIQLLKKNEPSSVDKQLTEALNKKETEVKKLKDSTPPLEPLNHITKIGEDQEYVRAEDSDMPRMQDNTKTTGRSGMELPEESAAPVKVTQKNLNKEPKMEKYTKNQILDILTSNGISIDEQAYVVLNNALK